MIRTMVPLANPDHAVAGGERAERGPLPRSRTAMRSGWEGPGHDREDGRREEREEMPRRGGETLGDGVEPEPATSASATIAAYGERGPSSRRRRRHGGPLIADAFLAIPAARRPGPARRLLAAGRTAR